MSVMTIGINPFRDKEGGDPLFKDLVVWFAKIDQDFMRTRWTGDAGMNMKSSGTS